MDSEERLELERELAAQLAALHETEEDECEIELKDSPDSYVRLDLDQVLRQSENDAAEEIDGGSTWDLLLANVQQCEADFFQPMQEELQELRDMILNTSIEETQPLSPTPSSELEEIPAQDQEADVVSEIVETPFQIHKQEAVEAFVCISTEEQHQWLDDTLTTSNAPIESLTDDAANESLNHDTYAPTQSSCPTEVKEITASLCFDQQRDKEILDKFSQDALNEDLTQQMQAIQIQLEERERWRRQIQEQQEREQEQAARWLQALELEMQIQDQEHQQRARERLEALELRRMQHEEVLMRLWFDGQRENRDREALAFEDQLSRDLHEQLKQQEQQQTQERSRMAQEEALVWRLFKLEQERQRKERLTEEKCTLRRLFMAVLAELVQQHSTRLAEQKRAEDAAKKRELRANADMRREELTQRRVIAQLQAFEVDQQRQQARAAMALEDELAFMLRQLDLERIAYEREKMTQEDECAYRLRQHLESELRLNCEAMAQEDSLALLYQAQLQRRRSGISTIERMREILVKRCLLKTSVARWLLVVQREHHATRCLQRFWRMQLAMIQVQLEDEQVESDPAVVSAAKAVQSAFRGFSIRRKFANALEMAKLVGAEDEAELFENVDLDELIALPPELADGWENPVLPALTAARICTPKAVQQHTTEHYERPVLHDEGENPDDHDHEEQEQEEPQEEHIPEQREANLAASIWSRMRRAKRKTQATALERVKQEDPTYRVQKLLHRVSAKSTTKNQTAHSSNEDKQPATVTWSTNNDSTKKKKKVKLPSLVDRLRKKTAAARDG